MTTVKLQIMERALLATINRKLKKDDEALKNVLINQNITAH
ncbi:hypothetical protein [Methylicorpusculum sp.]|nr:hypothetical protein [Methylicorpusculum sp.]MDO8843833.1 hypothetical protein [Methylicorpusculum sp.]